MRPTYLTRRTRTRVGGGGGVGAFGGRNGLSVVDAARSGSTYDFKTITGHANAHTKGDCTEIITASAGPATMVRVLVENTSATGAATSQLLDIATGADGFETVVIANLGSGYQAAWASGATPYPREWWIPLSIPAGTRIAARLQSVVATGDTASVAVELYSGGWDASAVDTIGANTATSKGVDVLAGSTVEGNWIEIEDSTTAAYRGLLYAVQGAGGTAMLTGFNALDIGKGAAASETAIVSNLLFASSSLEAVGMPAIQPLAPLIIPAGTRLAARIQTSASAQSFDVILYGLR